MLVRPTHKPTLREKLSTARPQCSTSLVIQLECSNHRVFRWWWVTSKAALLRDCVLGHSYVKSVRANQGIKQVLEEQVKRTFPQCQRYIDHFVGLRWNLCHLKLHTPLATTWHRRVNLDATWEGGG